MKKKTELKPIFIFSLPRSGSTLLQRILATSPDVATASEPWILLPFLYALKKEGVYAEYTHFCVHNALQDLCEEMPNGRDDYLAAVRLTMLDIYRKLSHGDERFFLDKTPRYSLIVEDVLKTFPDGKNIFLWRNPLSVVASIVETFYGGRWKLFHFKVDLYDGLENLIDVFHANRSCSLAIKYEDLIASSDVTLENIECYLGLESECLQKGDFSSVSLKGVMGDPTGVKKYQKISAKSLDGWKTTISNPWRKHWCRKYLTWIGKDRLSLMGYELDVLLVELDSIPNKWLGLLPDFFYSIYGWFYCFFNFYIMKEEFKKGFRKGNVKKHD